MPLRAVAFDVDGTLYPNASMYLQSLGLALSHLRLLKALERVRGELRRAPESSEDFHQRQARLIGERLGLSTEKAHALIETQVYTRWYRVFRKLKVFPGAVETIKAFKTAGLKVAALSDFPIRNRLADLGVGDLWDLAFSSEDTGYLKPHPRSFLELAERLGLPPADVLYVGNSYTYDVMGAAAAGMPSAHLTGSPHSHGKAVLSFRRYDELKSFVFQSLADSGYDALTGRVPV